MAMYRIWVNNADLDTSFLENLKDEFLKRWQDPLDEEDAKDEAEKAARNSGTAEGEDVRESTTGSTIGREVPEQHQDVSQPPRRRTTRVTIREPSNTPRADAPPAPMGKGKKKVSEPPAPIKEFSDENDMSSGYMFNRYTAPAAPSSRKKESKRHRGESNKAPSTKKARNEDLPAAAPSKEIMPPPAPLDQKSPPAPTDQNSTPLAPADQTPHDHPGDTLTSMVGLLTITAGWRRMRALVTQTKDSDSKHTEETKALEGKNAELLEKNTELLGKDTELLEQNSKLAEELQQFQTVLAKANEDKEKFKECAKLNYQESKQLEANLIASRNETEELEHNRGANFNYLSEHLRRTEIARCTARLEEEEKANIHASPEISLATGIDGAKNEAGTTVD
ncbi:uncharacterized protein LOC133791699 [Humulus lupulus]|uniref:uncharacterized protein LOC133791699 n=1 Tax=Humulus lupulus TaxID=3486 RepID=UPI002B411120|nr:uncharacterized protein LOC133791699 [Humulus lupulus]